MKLTLAVEKVRCPKCDTLFVAAKNRLQPQGPKKKKTAPPQKPTATSSFDFDDDNFGNDDDDLFAEASAPRKKRSRKPAPKKKSKRRSQPKPGAIPPEQIRKFGLTMVAIGIGVFILPFVGLQIKGLNAMSPEMQSLGGVCFLLLGGVVILISFKDALGDAASQTFDQGFTIVKWGAIGLFVLLIVGPFLLLGVRLAFRTVASVGGGNQDQIAQEELPPNFRRPIGTGSGTPPMKKRPVGNRNHANSGTNQATEESPFQDAGSGNSAGRPSMYPATHSAGESSQNRGTVKVILKGFPLQQVARHFLELRAAGQTARMRVMKIEENLAEVEFDQAAEIQLFANNIRFGKVTSVDGEQRTITVEP
ncbi:hypothetical protein [Thalassoglobus polymorphus]|nr:hypothetical protein [Thalassoglobus polymorphus]